MAATATQDDDGKAGRTAEDPRLRKRFVEYAFALLDESRALAAVPVPPGVTIDLATLIGGLPAAVDRIMSARRSPTMKPTTCEAYAQIGNETWDVIVKAGDGPSKVLEGLGGNDASACFYAIFADVATRRNVLTNPQAFAAAMAAWRPVLCAVRRDGRITGDLHLRFDEVMGALRPMIEDGLRARQGFEGSSP